MTPNEKQLEEVLAEIHASEPADLAIYSAYVGLKHHAEASRSLSIAELRWQGGMAFPAADAAAAAHHLESWIVRNGGADTSRFSMLTAGISALECDPGFAGAIAHLQPLCDERDRLRVAIAEDEAVARKLHQDLIDAEASATAAAIAKAHKSPEVVAARKALEAVTG